MRNAQDMSFKFDNYMFLDNMRRFIDSSTLQSEFGLIGKFAFLFILWVQSECLPIRRARITDSLSTKTRHVEMALIGPSAFNAETILVLKLTTRKGARYG